MHNSPTASIAAGAPRFNASAPVPQEYDVFCEGCGYSLLGLSTDRCPECGRHFDPTALPYARIPWLHRRRLGRWNAYWKTVWAVTFRPRDFAAELCRPVRISAEDARRFRRVTVHVAAIAGVIAITTLIVLTEGWAAPPGLAEPGLSILRFGLVFTAWGSSVNFLRLATDMPLFIWKGLPSLPETELAPLHHYASAPLALLPVVAVVALAPSIIKSALGDPFDIYLILNAIPVFLGVGWLLLCWQTPVLLMRRATGCSLGRALGLALYLPLHCFLMAVMVLLMASLVLGIGGWIFRSLFV